MGLNVSSSRRERLIGLELDESLVNAGWSLESVDLDGIPDTVENAVLNAHLLAGGALPFVRSQNVFTPTIPRLVEARIEELRGAGKIVFDSPKIRIDVEPTATSRISMTSYFNGLVTNDLCLRDFDMPDGRRLDGTEIAFPSGIIPPLDQSVLSNHVGSAALAIDEAGVLMFCRASSASAVGASRLAPSASGSCDVEDFNGKTNVVDAITSCLTRELREEGALDDVHVECRIVGFLRTLERGGKPEFIGLMKVHGRWSEVVGSLSDDERRFTDGHIFVDCAALGKDGLVAWISQNSSRLSYAAKTPLRALLNVMDQEDSDIADWLGLSSWHVAKRAA